MGLHDRTFKIAASEPTLETATLIHAGNIVRQLLVYLKANPIEEMTLVDIGHLPLPKTTIINAFRLLIASESRLEQRAQLQKVGLLLAQFQGSGEKTEPTAIAADPLASFIDTLAAEPISNEQLWLAAYREQEELSQLFDMSARMAERGNAMSHSEAEGQRQEKTLSN
jgi:hypothetical protein